MTYWIASGRRIVLLTVFGKTRMRQTREMDRARRALRRCITAEHTAETMARSESDVAAV